MRILGGVIILVVICSPAAFSEGPSEGQSPEAVAALQRLESGTPYERKVALLRLEALREAATAEAIKPYVESRDPDLRADSLRALAVVEGPKTVPLLVEHFKREAHPRVRWSVLLALEPFRETQPELLPLFIRAMRDHDPQVRLAAVDIVSRIDDPAAHEAIQARWRTELHPDVRRLLKRAVVPVKEP